MSFRNLLLIGLFVSSLLGAGDTGAYGDLERMKGDAAVKAAADGLREDSSFPWYDSEKDKICPLTLKEEKAPKETRDWVGKRRARKQSNWTWDWTWGDFLAGFFQLLAYGLLIGLALIVIYFLVTSPAVQEFFRTPEQLDDEPEKTDEERVENLPFDLSRPRADLLSETRRLYELGKYGEAMVYLFSYQLLQLDKNQWIRLAKGKTNRQYLGEIRGRRDLRGILQATMIPFEDFFFGHYQIDRERFESCWEQLDDFHQLVRPEGAN